MFDYSFLFCCEISKVDTHLKSEILFYPGENMVHSLVR